MSNREERESAAAINKKQRELESLEQKVEATQKALAKFLNKAKDVHEEDLKAELLEGIRHGSRNDAMDRFMKGESGNKVFNEPEITGFEKLPWEDED